MRRPFAAAFVVLSLGAMPAAAESPPPLDVDREIARVDAEEKRLASEADEARPRLDLTRRRIVARGRAYYRLTHAGLLPAGGGFDALVDYAARVERVRRALDRDLAAEAALVKHMAEVDQRLARLRVEKAPLAVQREALVHARQALQEASERRAAFARAFDSSVRPDAVAIYGADMGPSSDTGGGFRALRGRLPFPVGGRAEVARVHGDAGPAVELLAPFGTPVRTVAAGRVAFADRQEAYGLTVIVDHGDHYYSLYASLGSVDVRAGDTLTSGARLGTVGNVDGTRPRVMFEIRHNAVTVDPGPWLGL